MAGMTWLHLSDWHQRGKDFDRDVIRDKLIADIQNRTDIHADLAKIDFVIFSGDAAFSGQAEEYQVALKQLFTPLLKATGLNRSRLFFVPGNHDLDREELDYLPEDIKQPFTTETQVQDWLTDNKNRNHLLKPFAAYTDFVREFNDQKQPAYSCTRRFNIDGKQIAFLGLNSALMCGRNKDEKGEVTDQSYLVVGEPQLYEPLKQIAKTKVRIAVLHHPFDWLTEFDRDRVENLLIQNCHFILCGHLHKPNVTVQQGIAGDCVIIPAGASYDRRIAPNPRYANSYNFVHLDFEAEQVTVYLRRWSDPRGRWIEDIDSRKDGLFRFDFPKPLRDSLSLSQTAPIISTTMSHSNNVDDNIESRQISSSQTGSSRQNGQTTSVPSTPNNVYTLKSPSENFLEEARGYITEAQKCVRDSATPFNKEGYIMPRQLKEAVNSLTTTSEYMQKLHILLDTIPSLPAEVASNHQKLIGEIYSIAEQTDKLISYFGDPRTRRQDIREKFATLVLTLNELDMLIQDKEFPG